MVVFTAGWVAGGRLPDGKILRTASDLTYSVYLFHNWLRLGLSVFVGAYGLKSVSQDLQILTLLVLVCYLMHKVVDIQGIKLGKKLLADFRRHVALRAATGVIEIV